MNPYKKVNGNVMRSFPGYLYQSETELKFFCGS